MWGTVLALGVALLASYRMQSQQSALWIAANPDCDLQKQPCSTVLEGSGALTLAITPRPVIALKPLEFGVTLDSVSANQLWLEISGVNMAMGVTRILMQGQGDGTFKGKGLLPVCSVDQMEWRIRVVVVTPDGGFDRTFRLVTMRG